MSVARSTPSAMRNLRRRRSSRPPRYGLKSWLTRTSRPGSSRLPAPI